MKIDYSQLYWHNEIKFKEYPDSFSVQLRDINGTPDCKIGHFGYNRWFRTNAGLKCKEYSNETRMIAAIKKTAARMGLTYEAIIKISS